MRLPVISTQRTILRPWTLADAGALHELWTAPEVRRYLWDDVVISLDLAREIAESHLLSVERHGIGYWAIQVAPSAAIDGFCGFRFIDDGPEIELMYGLRGEYWGQGLATEACAAAIEYLWRATQFRRVYARTDPPNVASVEVMKRLGMSPHSTTESMITYLLQRV